MNTTVRICFLLFLVAFSALIVWGICLLIKIPQTELLQKGFSPVAVFILLLPLTALFISIYIRVVSALSPLSLNFKDEKIEKEENVLKRYGMWQKDKEDNYPTSDGIGCSGCNGCSVP